MTLIIVGVAFVKSLTACTRHSQVSAREVCVCNDHIEILYNLLPVVALITHVCNNNNK